MPAGIQVLVDGGSGFVDYSQYLLWQSIGIEDSLNQPTITTLALSNIDKEFVVPTRSSYLQIKSKKYNNYLSTGFIITEPEKEWIGVSGGRANENAFLQYKVTVVSDEWLLNVKSVPFIPAFVNQTMGQILQLLAETFAPGVFTFDVDDGDIVPIFRYDPNKKWSEYAKEFADSIRYRYQVINKRIYFKPYGDQPLGISYDDQTEHSLNGLFDPTTLNTRVLEVPVFNDVIVVGGVEPKKIREDHFIGDGITSDFTLRHTVFGGQTSLLLEEKWDGVTFEDDLWEVVDPDNRFVLNGALNLLAGSGPLSLGSAYIKGNNGLELGGHLDIEHGEFEFAGSGIGIIGGVYNSSLLDLGNCENGFYVSGNAISPIVDGAIGSQMITIAANKHYRLQTLISARTWSRYNKIYRTLAGATLGGVELASEAEVTFLVQEIDLNNPGTPFVVKHTETMTLSAFGLYAPVNSTNLEAVMTYTQIAKPIQGTLMVRSLYGPYGDQMPVVYSDAGSGNVTPAEEHYSLGFGLQNQTATIGTNNEQQQLRFYDDTIPTVGSRVRLRTWESGRAIARVRDDASVNVEGKISGDDGVRSAIVTDIVPQPRTSEDCDQAAKAFILDRNQTQYNGNYIFPDDFWDGTLIPNVRAEDNFNRQDVIGGLGTSSEGWSWELLSTFGLGAHLLQGNVARSTHNIGGTRALSRANKALNTDNQHVEADVFMDIVGSVDMGIYCRKDDTTTRTFYGLRISSGVLQIYKCVNDVRTVLASLGGGYAVNTIYKIALEVDGNTLRGYSGGVLRGEVVDSSIATGKYTGFDSFGNLFLYAYFDNFLAYDVDAGQTGVDYPRTGRFLNIKSPMRNISNRDFVARRVQIAVADLDQEKLVFNVEFGPDLYVPKLLPKFFRNREEILLPRDAAERPIIQEMADVGLTFLPDLENVRVIGLVTGTEVTVNVDQTLSGNSVEVRRVDSGWGKTDQNRITVETSQQFILQRSAIEQTWYLRMVGAGKTSRRTTALRVVYPIVPAAPSGFLDTRDWLKPEVHLSIPGDIRNVWGIEIRSCMESEGDELRQACGMLLGSWTHNSRVGPHEGPNDGELFGVFRNTTNAKKLDVQYTTDSGETWASADSSGAPTLANNILSHDSQKEGSDILIATQEDNGRVAYHRFSMSSKTWVTVNKQVIATADLAAAGQNRHAVSVTKTVTTGYIVVQYDADRENVSGLKGRVGLKVSTDDGTTWGSQINTGDYGADQDNTPARVIAGLGDRYHSYFSRTPGTLGTPDLCVQTVSGSGTIASSVLVWADTNVTHGSSPPIYIGDYATYLGSSTGLSIILPLKQSFGQAGYAIFTDADSMVAPAIIYLPGNPSIHQSPSVAACPQMSMRYLDGFLHLLASKLSQGAEDHWIFHKKSTLSGTFVPTGATDNQVGPQYAPTTFEQEMGGHVLDINGHACVATFTNIDPIAGKNIVFNLIPVQELPSPSTLTLTEWLANCNTAITPETAANEVIDLEAPIEILDRGLKANSTDYRFRSSEWLYDHTIYDAGTEAYFEGNFTNKSFTLSRTVKIWKMLRDRAGSPAPVLAHTLTVPPQVYDKRIKFTSKFDAAAFDTLPPSVNGPSSTSGVVGYEDAYQIELQEEPQYVTVYPPPAVLPDAPFEVHSLRLIPYTKGASKGVVNIPMSSDKSAASIFDQAAFPFSTSSTSFVDISTSSVWQYTASEWGTIVSLKLEATLLQNVTGKAQCALVDKGTDAVIATAEFDPTVSSEARAVGITFLASALTSGHKYVVRLRSTDGSGAALFYKARLRIVLDPLEKTNVYWREGYAEELDNRRSRIFYNPGINSTLVSTSVEVIGASGQVVLYKGLTSDGTTTAYPGWFGYYGPDHVPAQNYTVATNMAPFVEAYNKKKSAGTLTIDDAKDLIHQITAAAWQFELFAATLPGPGPAQGIVDINALRDAIISGANSDLTSLIAALKATGAGGVTGTSVTLPSTKDVTKVVLSPANFTEGNRYWGYGTAGHIQSLLVYSLTTPGLEDEAQVPKRPIHIGDVLMRRVFKSPTDLIWMFDNTQYRVRNLCFDCYFFNLMWEYSPSKELTDYLPPPSAPVIEVVSVQGIDINIRINRISVIDTVSVLVEISTNPNFTSNVTRLKGGPLHSVYSLHAVGGVGAQDQYIRAKRTDYLGDSDWSNVVFVSGALIQSTVTASSNQTANRIATFTGTGNTIQGIGPGVVSDGRIVNVTAPTLSGDAATKHYVDVLVAAVSGQAKHHTIVAEIGNGVDVILTGARGNLPLTFNGRLVSVTMVAAVSGSIVVDIRKDTYNNYSAIEPSSGDSICASAKPTISSAIKSQDLTLSGWTKTFSKFDVYRYYVESVIGITLVTLSLETEE